ERQPGATSGSLETRRAVTRPYSAGSQIGPALRGACPNLSAVVRVDDGREAVCPLGRLTVAVAGIVSTTFARQRVATRCVSESMILMTCPNSLGFSSAAAVSWLLLV